MKLLHSPPFKLSRCDWQNIAQWLLVTAGGATVMWLAEHSLPELREASGVKALLVTVAVAVGRGAYLFVRDGRNQGHP